MGLMLGRYLAVLCVCVAAPAQTAAPQGAPPAAPAKAAEPSAQHQINVSVNEVIVPVTVTDDKGKFVSDL